MSEMFKAFRLTLSCGYVVECFHTLHPEKEITHECFKHNKEERIIKIEPFEIPVVNRA